MAAGAVVAGAVAAGAGVVAAGAGAVVAGAVGAGAEAAGAVAAGAVVASVLLAPASPPLVPGNDPTFSFYAGTVILFCATAVSVGFFAASPDKEAASAASFDGLSGVSFLVSGFAEAAPVVGEIGLGGFSFELSVSPAGVAFPLAYSLFKASSFYY